MPFTVLRSLYSLKRTAEVRAGRGGSVQIDQIKNAILTGALTLGSFYVIFDLWVATMLLVVVFLHELGHVAAMRSAGIPVRGIYFIPFFGGVAVGESFGRTEATRGFIALMGPAASMLTTGLFLWLSVQSTEPALSDLAIMSAAVNGFNLLPILPLDGGRILQALTSRMTPRGARAIHVSTLAAGIGIAAFLRDYLLLGLILLMVPGVLLVKPRPSIYRKPRPLSLREAVWLTAGYVATFAFYLFVGLRLWNEALATGGS